MEGTVTIQEQRETWLKERRSGIGGSDAAAILGVSPWRTALDIYSDKRGISPLSTEPTSPMWWGTAMEDLIAKRYCEMTGFTICEDKPGIYRHGTHKELLGTPDRLVTVSGNVRGLEIKTSSQYLAQEWGNPGTDDVPTYYAAQCAHYMAVCDVDSWDLAVLIGGNDLRIFTLYRDLELEKSMIKTLTSWWKAHVLAGIPPEPSDPADESRYLKNLFPRNVGERKEADEEIQEVASKLEKALEYMTVAEERVEMCRNALKKYIGDADGVDGDGWKATWKLTSETSATNWARVAEYAMEAISREGLWGKIGKDPNAIISKFTELRPGHRRFTFTNGRRNGSGK